MKSVLVAGGAGFIGSHLCERLLELNYRVFCLDNFITGSKKNISHLLDNKNFELIKADISDNFEFNEKVVEIFDLASPASPIAYANNPIETLMANSLGLKNLLELAKKQKARFLFTSTSEIYGDPKEHPQSESYWGNVNPIGERSCYDESKRFGEALISSYNRKFGLKAKIVRIFNTFGPRMQSNDGRVIPNFINQALNGKPLTVFGDGSFTRSYCFVSDLVEGLIKMMDSTELGPINLGNPTELSNLQLAEKIKKLTHSDSEIVFRDFPLKDDPQKRRPDISMAKKLLQWEPKVLFEDGLMQTIDFFKQK